MNLNWLVLLVLLLLAFFMYIFFKSLILPYWCLLFPVYTNIYLYFVFVYIYCAFFSDPFRWGHLTDSFRACSRRSHYYNFLFKFILYNIQSNECNGTKKYKQQQLKHQQQQIGIIFVNFQLSLGPLIYETEREVFLALLFRWLLLLLLNLFLHVLRLSPFSSQFEDPFSGLKPNPRALWGTNRSECMPLKRMKSL